MSFSDFLEGELLDHVFKIGAAFPQPTNIYIALSTADPLDDNSGLAEPVGNGYARVLNNVNWARTVSQIDNNAAVTFPQATGSWGTITHFGIFDAITAGNQLGSGALSTSRLVNSGDTPEFAINDITVTLD